MADPLPELRAALADRYRVRARARPRRHGHGLSRPRPAARPAGRAQGAAPRARRRSGPSVSSARSRSPPACSTRTSSRSSTPARTAGRLSGSPCRSSTARRCAPASARAAAAGRGRGPDRAGGGRRAGVRAPPGRDPPRREAGEHPARRDGHALVADFGIARAPSGGDDGQHHHQRHDRRHPGVHEPGAGGGRRRARRPLGPVFARLRAVGDARGRAAVLGADDAGGAGPPVHRDAAAAAAGAGHRARGGRARGGRGRCPSLRRTGSAALPSSARRCATASRGSAEPPRPRRARRPRLLAAAFAVVLRGRGADRLAPAAARAPKRPTPGGPKRLAVLPFENLGRPEDAYFADGITDEIRGKLARRCRACRSPPRAARASTGRPARRRRRSARELGVGVPADRQGAMGKGRRRRQPGAGEPRAGPGGRRRRTRWQQPFDASLTDVFQVQADVASRVAQAHGRGARRDSEQHALAGKPTASLAGLRCCTCRATRRRAASTRRRRAGLRRAIGFYERAVAIDSTFAPAWAQLSRAHTYLYQISLPTGGRRRAGESRRRASAGAGAGPWRRRYLALGDYYNLILNDGAAALREYHVGPPARAQRRRAAQGHRPGGTDAGRLGAQPGVAHPGTRVLDPRSIAVARRLTYNLVRAAPLPGGRSRRRPGRGARPARA